MTRQTSGAGLPLDKVPVAANTHDAARPSREQVVAAVMLVIDFVTGARAETIYDQWHLPSDARSSDQYKRRHRQLRAAGVEGAWTRGKSLVCTHAAWMTRLEKPKAAKLALVADVVDRERAIDEALGIHTRAR